MRGWRCATQNVSMYPITAAVRTTLQKGEQQQNLQVLSCPPRHALLSRPAGTGLFALRQLCTLLGADVGSALELVKREPGLLDTPASSLEARLGVRSIHPTPPRIWCCKQTKGMLLPTLDGLH